MEMEVWDRDEWGMMIIMWISVRSNMRNEFVFKNEMDNYFEKMKWNDSRDDINVWTYCD